MFVLIFILFSFQTVFAFVEDVNEADFDTIIDQVVNAYEGFGDKKLLVSKDWKSDKLAITPRDRGDVFTLDVHGGMLREKSVTKDGFMLMICHELGHFFAGAPTYGDDALTPEERDLSIEGQSDYWSLKCFRKINKKANNMLFVKNFLEKNGKRHALKDIIPESLNLCRRVWNSHEKVALCRRGVFASHSFARTARIKRLEKYWVNITTPSDYIVEETYKFHPAAQCRFDTFVAGALCPKRQGDCTREEGFTISVRPLCWYKP